MATPTVNDSNVQVYIDKIKLYSYIEEGVKKYGNESLSDILDIIEPQIDQKRRDTEKRKSLMSVRLNRITALIKKINSKIEDDGISTKYPNYYNILSTYSGISEYMDSFNDTVNTKMIYPSLHVLRSYRREQKELSRKIQYYDELITSYDNLKTDIETLRTLCS